MYIEIFRRDLVRFIYFFKLNPTLFNQTDGIEFLLLNWEEI
jgi:hypothetical protein